VAVSLWSTLPYATPPWRSCRLSHRSSHQIDSRADAYQQEWWTTRPPRGPESETINSRRPPDRRTPPFARATELPVARFRRLQTMKTPPSTWDKCRRCWVDKLRESQKTAALNQSDAVLASGVQALAQNWISMTRPRQILLLADCTCAMTGGLLCPLQPMSRRCQLVAPVTGCETRSSVRVQNSVRSTRALFVLSAALSSNDLGLSETGAKLSVSTIVYLLHRAHRIRLGTVLAAQGHRRGPTACPPLPLPLRPQVKNLSGNMGKL